MSEKAKERNLRFETFDNAHAQQRPFCISSANNDMADTPFLNKDK